ncbi:MAG: alanyl-tRNA editing protein [Thermoplasmatales archaeon]|nr:alanyl-tRNA editing protein [Thermoplasmatales archaeon]
MVDEIFKRDGYVSEFEAEVTSVDGEWVAFGGTAFFPGGGGQAHDTGHAGGFPVTEVRRDGGDIWHRIPGHPFSAGDRIWCGVDWDRRYDLMKGHTAEHLLFHYLGEGDPGLEIVKISIAPEGKHVVVTRDVPWRIVADAVAKANAAVSENHPVTWVTMGRDEVESEGVRAKLERIEGDRITVAAIGDVDVAACSGIHVMETGEIGQIFVDRKVSAGKDGVAIHFKVGDEAREASNELAYLGLEAIDAMDSKPGDLLKTIGNARDELASLKKASRDASKALLFGIAPENFGGVDVYAGSFPVDRDSMVEAAESIRGGGGVALFASAAWPAVVAASGTDRVDCKKILSEVLPEFGGKGGGKKEFAQGGVPVEDAERAVDALKAAVAASLSP